MHVRCCLLLASFSSSHHLESDCGATSRHHIGLLDKSHWELSTPSRSLPVLGVLARSGIFIEGIESAAAQPLANMTPFMTASERSMLGKVSQFFTSTSTTNRQGGASSTTGDLLSGTAADRTLHRDGAHAKAETEQHQMTSLQAEEAVVAMYAAACSKRPFIIPTFAVVDSDFCELLGLPCSLMLLELIVSRAMNAQGLVGYPIDALLARVRRLLTSAKDHSKIEFRTVWWLTMILQGDPRWFRVSIPPSRGGTALFACCVRMTHDQLPTLSAEQRLLAYLGLSRSRDAKYDHPFVVLSELEKIIAATSPDEFAAVPTDTLLHFMNTSFTQKHPKLFGQLCIAWYGSGRIADMNADQARLALHMLGKLHVRAGSDGAFPGDVRPDDWQRLHDSLFAQLFIFANDLGFPDCVAILEDAEVIHASAVGIYAPSTFLIKMKARTFDTLRTFIKRLGSASRAPSQEELERSYEAVLRFEALLLRYALVPCSDREEKIVAHCSAALRRHVLRGIGPDIVP